MTAAPVLVRTLAATAVLLAAATTLTGCSTTTDLHWRSTAAAKDRSDFSAVPSLVAADATDIDLRGSDIAVRTAIRWRSKQGIVREDCEAGPISGGSRLGAPWWPKTIPAQGWTCGWWTVFEKDGSYFAWDHRNS